MGRFNAIRCSLAAGLTIATSSCLTPPQAPLATRAAQDSIVEDARGFMDSYARDLVAGDRAAIARRYDRTGAYFLGNGEKSFETYVQITDYYAGPRFSPPTSFEWRDLSFEPVGPDAIIIAGTFLSGRAGVRAGITSYTGLLRRQNGELRIRLEDESRARLPSAI